MEQQVELAESSDSDYGQPPPRLNQLILLVEHLGGAVDARGSV